ncbi:MAG: T9SS type A sorting domain-containing protein [candidate division KSB1 bacterium]|nr:T9SS type A sorting domain-containing protein [candidate division KSB1 bacterium]MDZ7304380.1 T9SS type A sorting domain-containing protein [candidate division KSB1 bacterium]MDZ7313529.1 T9SS type A sorting domain-containing protein [candidate division KSB1 bacterium]
MMRKIAIFNWTMLLLAGMFASLTFAQTAMIKIEGYSPQEIHNLGWTSPRSTGLSVVGVNQLVYLIGRDSLNAVVTSYAWTLTTKPAGSVAVLDSADKKQTTFKPDVVGKFTVQLVITTAAGTSKPKTVTITAAKFIGVGGMDGLPQAYPQCSVCHTGNFQQWTKTGHSSIFTNAIDGKVSDHYAEYCIECHTTGYDLDADGNDGFDDVQKELGWKFPAKLQSGNWDTLKTFFTKLAARANIQCESCHGPGSQHNALGPDKTSIAMSLDEATCGYCHEEEPYHRKNQQWKESVHASTALEAYANREGCDRCHSGWAFIRRVDVKSPDNRPLRGFGQISCAVCHDPHRADLPAQVRTLANVTLGDSVKVVNYGGMGKVCMQCHISRQAAVDYTNNPANLSTRFGPHHSNQADMIDGSNAIEYDIPIGSSGHKFAATDACVTCHMAATPAAGQRGHDKVGEHTFAMKWDGGTPTDPSDDVENVAICQGCHGPIESFDDIMAKADYDEDGTIEGTRHEVEGLVEKLDKLLPPRTNNTVIANNYNWTQPGLTPAEVAKRKAYTKAWFNLLFVEEDGSMGVHNAAYAITLLRRSIASITTGDVGAAEIISITDVPNDQGKQVRVAWSKFPGDGISTNPINAYSVWRRVDDVKGATQVSSKSTMLGQANSGNVGSRFTIAQAGTWDFVAWVPAVGHEFYSTVVPTLYDSTAKGIKWSVFFVAGHARNMTVETAPDSGYSVDNLVPATPSNVVLSILPTNKVSLKWDDPVDPDFQYFAVYRGTTPGFDPKLTKPIATLIGTTYTDSDVVFGNKYYYRVSAFDFSGNESLPSPELLASITSVAERGNGGVPTEYALEQNYPNPFNPETSIKYQLPLASHVKLSIYTSLGQEVRRLIDGTQPAAYHVVAWDGRDNNGNPLPSGVYFYRLETENFTAIKKMVMMK